MERTLIQLPYLNFSVMVLKNPQLLYSLTIINFLLIFMLRASLILSQKPWHLGTASLYLVASRYFYTLKYLYF